MNPTTNLSKELTIHNHPSVEGSTYYVAIFFQEI